MKSFPGPSLLALRKGLKAVANPPELDDLSVTVNPIELGEEEVFNRLASWAMAVAPRCPRAEAERIGPSDEAQIEVVCMCAGRVVPMSAFGPVWVWVPVSFTVGVGAELLVERKVGEPFDVELRLPSSHWDPRLAAAPARLIGRVIAARELSIGAFDTDEFWRDCGRFGSLAEAVRGAVQVLEEERATDAWLTALSRAYEVLLRRCPVEVADEDIDRELVARWHRADGQVLRAMRVDSEVMDESRSAWLTSPPLRDAARRSIAIARLNLGIARRDGLTLTLTDVEAFGASLGIADEVLARLFQLNGYEVLQTISSMRIAEHIMHRVNVHAASGPIGSLGGAAAGAVRNMVNRNAGAGSPCDGIDDE